MNLQRNGIVLVDGFVQWIITQKVFFKSAWCTWSCNNVIVAWRSK